MKETPGPKAVKFEDNVDELTPENDSQAIKSDSKPLPGSIVSKLKPVKVDLVENPFNTSSYSPSKARHSHVKSNHQPQMFSVSQEYDQDNNDDVLSSDNELEIA